MTDENASNLVVGTPNGAAGGRQRKANWLARLQRRMAFPVDARKKFYLHLADKMENGVGKVQVLRVLRDRASTRKGPHKTETKLYSQFLHESQSGRQLNQVMGDYVSPPELMLLATGEESGQQIMTLRLAARLAEVRKRIVNTVLKGAISPIMMFFALYLMLAFIGRYLVPKLAVISKPSTWTGNAHLLYLLSQFTKSDGVWILPLILGSLFFYWIYRLPSWEGGAWTGSFGVGLRTWLDNHVPPWMIYRIVEGGTWIIAYTTMLQAGVGRIEALEFQMRHAKPWLRKRLEWPAQHMTEGTEIGQIFQRSPYKFPSQSLIDDIEDYADSENFHEILQRVGDAWVDTSLLTVQAIMNGIRNFSMAAFIGVFMWVMISTVQLSMQAGNAATHMVH